MYKHIFVLGFPCKYCNKTFERKLNRDLHIRSHHPEDIGVKVVELPVRNEGFLTERQFFDKQIDTSHQKVRLFNDSSNIKEKIRNTIRERCRREMITEKPAPLKVTINLHMSFKYHAIDEIKLTDPPVSYHTKMPMIFHVNSHIGTAIDHCVDKYFDDVTVFIDEFIQNGSGWIFNEYLDADITFMRFIALIGCAKIKIPRYLIRKQTLINVNNNDEKCFKWAILSSLHPAKKDPQRVTKYQPYEHELDDSDLQYPVDPMAYKELNVFSQKNNVSFTIILCREKKHFTSEEEVVKDGDDVELAILHCSEVVIENNHVFLMFITDDEGNSHYCWIKNMSRLMKGRVGWKRNEAKRCCPRCLTGCREQSYEKHAKYCRDLNKEQAIRFPEDSTLKWGNLQHLRKTKAVPFVIYADFESVLEKCTDDENCKAAYQKHVPISYCINVVCIDKVWNKQPITYTGLDCMERFFEDMEKINEDIRMVYAITNPMSPLTEEEEFEYELGQECYVCNKRFNNLEENDKKVRDHCHLTGKYIGPACSYCNLNVTSINYETHPIVCVFHNLKGYDMHHILHYLTNQRVSVIGSSSEKFLCARIRHRFISKGEPINAHCIKYIDSAAFLQSSLATLALNLPEEKLYATKHFCENFFKEREGQICYPEEVLTTGELAFDDVKRMEKPIYLSTDHRFDYRNYRQPPNTGTPLQARHALILLRRKGVYPYDWMDDASKMNCEALPTIEEFYNKKDDEHISEEDYQHAQCVWEYFRCQTFKDYHELYLQTDVMLLTDVFEEFRSMCLGEYKVDPAQYVSLPAMSWDSMLKQTRVSLELFQPQTHSILARFERGIRGGISIATKRYAKADDNNSIIYLGKLHL